MQARCVECGRFVQWPYLLCERCDNALETQDYDGFPFQWHTKMCCLVRQVHEGEMEYEEAYNHLREVKER